MKQRVCHVILSGAKNPGPASDRPGWHVILSGAKNLCSANEILRSTQNDIPVGIFHSTALIALPHYNTIVKNMFEIRLIVRAAHILAAAAWLGGNIMYLAVIVPALKLAGPAPAVAAQIAALFRQLTNICIGVLLLSGAYLTFDRLTETTLGWPYLVTLAVKIAVALVMFVLAIYIGQSNIRKLAKRTTRLSKVAPQLILALGICVFILGALLNLLFEAALAPH